MIISIPELKTKRSALQQATNFTVLYNPTTDIFILTDVYGNSERIGKVYLDLSKLTERMQIAIDKLNERNK